MLKDIKNFEGLYAASDDGRIWSYPKKWANRKHNGKWLKPWKIGHGYECVALYPKPKKKESYLVHRLIAQTFIPNPNNLREVNHKNAIMTDNRIENLEWVTSCQNKQHAIKLGLYPRGFENKSCFLNKKQVLDIRNSNKTGVEMSKKYNVSTALISLVRNKKHYSFV